LSNERFLPLASGFQGSVCWRFSRNHRLSKQSEKSKLHGFARRQRILSHHLLFPKLLRLKFHLACIQFLGITSAPLRALLPMLSRILSTSERIRIWLPIKKDYVRKIILFSYYRRLGRINDSEIYYHNFSQQEIQKQESRSIFSCPYSIIIIAVLFFPFNFAISYTHH
jgi:hypothetical protein